MKQTLTWFNLHRDGTGNGLPNTSVTFAESLQLNVSSASKYVHLQGWSLKLSSYDDWAKYKEKVPDVSNPHQNVETTFNSKLNFT